VRIEGNRDSATAVEVSLGYAPRAGKLGETVADLQARWNAR
jgi:hypothetical protein